MSEHTPTPWEVFSTDNIKGPGGNIVAECTGYSVKAKDPAQKAQGGREANAEHIVRCVNAHDGLVGLLRDLTAFCASHTANGCKGKEGPLARMFADDPRHLAASVDAARAELDKLRD